MVDAFRARHPDARAYTWVARRAVRDAARVDFALVSPVLADRVVDAQIHADARGPSDHAPISITLG